ncbi:hypothetical protein BJY01DRAFT_251977 [Aspergillus pseudoustus]|uniref:SnoaL-like domain-containing protein n=1 Tax=Aspergillus pseudoustus TaxID=1810923 RepID=A0ABR4J8L2_9EURO
MGYPTVSTTWPKTLPLEIRLLVDRFFILADTKSNDAGARLAHEVFIPDGQFISPHATFTGSAEIRESRRNAWVTITSRQHTVSKVYVNDARGADLIIVGYLKTKSVDGQQACMDFVARMVFDMGSSEARARLYRVISPPVQDIAPLLADD